MIAIGRPEESRTNRVIAPDSPGWSARDPPVRRADGVSPELLSAPPDALGKAERSASPRLPEGKPEAGWSPSPVSSLARWTREGANALPNCWSRRGAPYASFTGDAGLGASPVSEALLFARVAVPPNRRLYGGASLLS